MRVSLLCFDETTNEYNETELPVDIIEDGTFALFPIYKLKCAYGDREDKPIEFYVKIYKDNEKEEI